MAKADKVGFVEQHVEKFVVGLCAIAFLYALFHWGLSSPRSLNGLAPDRIDASIEQEAEKISRDMAGRTAPPVDVPDSKPWFEQRQKVYGLDQLPRMVQFGATQPPIGAGRKIATGRKVSLEEMAAIVPGPGKVSVCAGQELPRTETPADTLAAHIAVVYPWGELVTRWNEELKETLVPLQVITSDVEVECRQMQPDGGWGQWETLATTVPAMSGDEPIRPVVPVPSDENREEVRQAVEALKGWQEQILQPEYWDVWWPGHGWVTWLYRLPTNEVAVVPAEEEDALGAPRTRGPSPAPSVPRRTVPKKPAYQPMPGMAPGGMGMPVPGRSPTRTSPRPSSPRPSRTTVVRPSAPLDIAPLPGLAEVPTLEQQMVDGKVLVWLHTTALESGKTYQFRVRLVFVNPLVGQDAGVKDPARDSAAVALLTPWSQLSEEVYLPKATEFFVTGFSSNAGTVNVAVFTQSLGQTVRRNFSVKVGESIGAKRKVDVIDPINEIQTNTEVDFSTGAVAVAFDFNKRVLKGALYSTTVEMLYMDEKGELRSRICIVDEDSHRYKKLRKDAKQAEEAVRGSIAAR